MDLDTNNHSVFKLSYHLVLVIKYRRKVIDDDISKRIQYLIAHHHTYDHVDGIDYQILIEADFLVNIMEDHLSKEDAKKAYDRIFKTDCGKTICREMFGL